MSEGTPWLPFGVGDRESKARGRICGVSAWETYPLVLSWLCFTDPFGQLGSREPLLGMMFLERKPIILKCVSQNMIHVNLQYMCCFISTLRHKLWWQVCDLPSLRRGT